ncbi:MAG TPA: hypothetical protein VF938_05620, partial [Candidatus Angelobacter sp.]
MRGLNLLVFRGDRRRVCGYTLKAALIEQLRLLCGDNSREQLIGALLRVGELECGLADADGAAHSAELLTDQIADALLQVERWSGCPESDFQASNSYSANFQNISFPTLLNAAQGFTAIEQLSIATSEGFAYYALHPLAYADVLDQVSGSEAPLLIVGIRSIGTTLSAVMVAAARRQGIKVDRLTVRPQGHPYNRTAEFCARQLAAIDQYASLGATFVVVDEGPGLSGSSFLAVAEALEQAGAPLRKIMLVSSHAPNIETLCAADAARRWQRFRCVAVSGEARRPSQAVDFTGGGKWRSRAFSSESEWPAIWTSFERPKYLSSTEHENPRLYKFAGLGHYGGEVCERELKVSAAGFGPMPRQESDGFVSYPCIDGRPLAARNLSSPILARMADYCAFRLRTFHVELAELNALQQMAKHNLRELGLDSPIELRLEHAVIADGGMQPHEWLVTKEGRLLKTDSGGHGDDHFFPGPTDIAWDLAGAIVEWGLNEQQVREFIDLYRCASCDDPSARIDGFIRAYAVFRAAYC